MRTTLPLLLLAAASAWAAPAAAQQPGPCGEAAYPAERLARVVGFFVDERYDAARAELGIQRLPADVNAAVVTGATECGRVQAALMRHLARSDAWPELQKDGFEYVILDIGPYYAVRVLALNSDGSAADGHAVLKIFAEDSLELIAEILV